MDNNKNKKKMLDIRHVDLVNQNCWVVYFSQINFDATIGGLHGAHHMQIVKISEKH